MNISYREVRSDVAYGVSGACVTYPLSIATIEASRYLFEKWDIPFNRILLSKNFDWIYRSIGAIQSGLMRGIFKTFLAAYLIVVGPVLEEWAFRGVLYRYQEIHMSMPVRILSNATAFGAIHLSYFHGLASIPYFLVATIAGVVYACLREWTKSWHSSAIAHGISNACVIALETLR